MNWRRLLLRDCICTIFGHLPLQDVSSVASSVWAGCPTLPWWRPSSASRVWHSSAAVAMWHWPAHSLCWRTTSPGSPVTTPPSPWCKFKGHGLSNTQLQENQICLLVSRIQIFQYIIYGIASFFFVYAIILLAEGFYTTSAIKKELQSDFKTTVCGRCITAFVREQNGLKSPIHVRWRENVNFPSQWCKLPHPLAHTKRW